MPINENLREVIGGVGEKRSTAIFKLVDNGIMISPTTLSGLRAGYESGSRLQIRFDSAIAMENDDPSLKLGYFLELLDVSQELLFQYSGLNQPFVLDGLSDSVGERLGIKGKMVSEIIKGMRSDIAFQDVVSKDPSEIRALFEAVVNRFYDRKDPRGRRVGGSQIRKAIDDWHESSDASIANFYRFLYKHGTYSIAGWYSSEIEFMQEYYEMQQSGFSELDKLILKTTVENNPRTAVSDHIRNVSGVPFSPDLFATYRNLLVYGSPVLNKS